MKSQEIKVIVKDLHKEAPGWKSVLIKIGNRGTSLLINDKDKISGSISLTGLKFSPKQASELFEKIYKVLRKIN